MKGMKIIMPTPFERREAGRQTTHHLLFERPQWHAREFSHRLSTLGSYTIDLTRAPHDYLHQIIKPVAVPSKAVCDTSYEIGQQYSKIRNDNSRLDQIVDELTHEAHVEHSPIRAHQFFELATSISAQLAVAEYFKGNVK